MISFLQLSSYSIYVSCSVRLCWESTGVHLSRGLQVVTATFLVVFCAFYCYDGLFRERQFEMIGYAIGAFVIMVYIIGNYWTNGKENQNIRLVGQILPYLHTHPTPSFVTPYRFGLSWCLSLGLLIFPWHSLSGGGWATLPSQLLVVTYS